MGFRFSRRWCLTGGGPRGRCPPSWAGTRFFFWGSAPRVYARPPMRGGAAPLQEQVVRLGSSLLPMGRALRPSTPGDFPIAEKVTKGAPRASPFGIPRCGVTALFALAALRSGSRRATFYHQPRSICHFEMGGRIGLFFSLGFCEGTPSGFRPWRGRWAN